MKILVRGAGGQTDRENAQFRNQNPRINFIYVENQVGTDRLIYTITYPYDKNTRANRDEFKIHADLQVRRAVQRLKDRPLPPTGPDSEERPLQPIADIGKSL